MNAFYGRLAPWWPLISPLEDYADEAEWIGRLLGEARTVLELGSGGGHNAFFLAERFDLTLVDLSRAMLQQSEALNPGCRHVRGDMRTVRLGETFDAVFVHDAIDYMTTLADLRAAIATAVAHCRAGGVVLIIPDDLAETFEPSTDCGGSDAEDGRGVRYLEWTWDPDPDDAMVRTEYTFTLRGADGRIDVVHETHHTGLFARATWVALLEAQGLVVEALVEQTDEDRVPRTAFRCTAP